MCDFLINLSITNNIDGFYAARYYFIILVHYIIYFYLSAFS